MACHILELTNNWDALVMHLGLRNCSAIDGVKGPHEHCDDLEQTLETTQHSLTGLTLFLFR